MSQINIKFPDGSIKQFDSGVTALLNALDSDTFKFERIDSINDVLASIKSTLESTNDMFESFPSIMTIAKTIIKGAMIMEGIMPYLLDFVKVLGNELISVGILDEGFDIDEYMELVPMQLGDVTATYADTSDLERDTGFKPSITIYDGLKVFAKWYKDFYGK